MAETFTGTREIVMWTVVRNAVYLLHGDNEKQARADYEQRAKTLHKGETLRLERTSRIETWEQTTQIVEATSKPGEQPRGQ